MSIQVICFSIFHRQGGGWRILCAASLRVGQAQAERWLFAARPTRINRTQVRHVVASNFSWRVDTTFICIYVCKVKKAREKVVEVQKQPHAICPPSAWWSCQWEARILRKAKMNWSICKTTNKRKKQQRKTQTRSETQSRLDEFELESITCDANLSLRTANSKPLHRAPFANDKCASTQKRQHWIRWWWYCVLKVLMMCVEKEWWKWKLWFEDKDEWESEVKMMMKCENTNIGCHDIDVWW